MASRKTKKILTKKISPHKIWDLILNSNILQVIFQQILQETFTEKKSRFFIIVIQYYFRKHSISNPIISIEVLINSQKKNPRENLAKINFKIVSHERDQK